MSTSASTPGQASGRDAGKSGRNLLKAVPGVLISLFFLWYTFKGISYEEMRGLRLAHPVWILGVLGFTLAGYTLRCVRWTTMMRPTGARFSACARVLMVSLAANNILPLRIGDIMRVFTYADDLGASPSVILSTVILEKLLDIFTLVVLFAATMSSIATHRLHVIVYVSLAVSALGLLVLLLGARALQPHVSRLFQRYGKNPKLAKAEHWVMLALDAVARIGIAGSLLLLAQSAVIWFCEGMIYLASINLVGIRGDHVSAWLAVSFANLSYLIPSSPGSIGPFELAVKTALVSHGAAAPQAAVFSLALHVWLLVSITGAGGVIFLVHRIRTHNHRPLLEEIETLPAEMP
ncbi:lysylphosphatidylglycerol synthase transmembrane domain-containing protein [Edaphobacter sp.]|uniref:lysylphosphatidylglycerol synthase transmembrane domain-containing protein n=1 Tax=Edaphobacter sp. TaxID=1934404 RepID=UPI002DBF9A99|nr:lysylphosphatidylglycerol synthase transmembrane domain-containing protein [Edaphobacter sp.]HEU5342323.1 lysylphosphatidylglycerol synthase transmembrane domain-containing protein [Edaphobacter sp.]